MPACMETPAINSHFRCDFGTTRPMKSSSSSTRMLHVRSVTNGPLKSNGRSQLASHDAAPIEGVPISVLAHVSVNFVVKVSYSSPAILVSVKK